MTASKFKRFSLFRSSSRSGSASNMDAAATGNTNTATRGISNAHSDPLSSSSHGESDSKSNSKSNLKSQAEHVQTNHRNEPTPTSPSSPSQSQSPSQQPSSSLSQCHSPATISIPGPLHITNTSTATSNYNSTCFSNSSANRRRSSTYPSSPRRSSASPSPPPRNRARLNSREIPRTYSGLYGIGGGHELTHQTQTPASDLLPFELARNFNTEWLLSYPHRDYHHNNTNHLRNNIMSSSLLWIYIFFILFVEFTLVVLPLPFVQNHVEFTLTITNIIHGVITLIFLHWLKGSPNFYDYGELNAMTLWEQLSCSPESNTLAVQTKQVLYIIPTVLCYFSCRFVNFEIWISLLNLGVWVVCIVAKMEGMHGVRLFGLNRTIGIDDDVRKMQ